MVYRRGKKSKKAKKGKSRKSRSKKTDTVDQKPVNQTQKKEDLVFDLEEDEFDVKQFKKEQLRLKAKDRLEFLKARRTRYGIQDYRDGLQAKQQRADNNIAKMQEIAKSIKGKRGRDRAAKNLGSMLSPEQMTALLNDSKFNSEQRRQMKQKFANSGTRGNERVERMEKVDLDKVHVSASTMTEEQKDTLPVRRGRGRVKSKAMQAEPGKKPLVVKDVFPAVTRLALLREFKDGKWPTGNQKLLSVTSLQLPDFMESPKIQAQQTVPDDVQERFDAGEERVVKDDYSYTNVDGLYLRSPNVRHKMVPYREPAEKFVDWIKKHVGSEFSYLKFCELLHPFGIIPSADGTYDKTFLLIGDEYQSLSKLSTVPLFTMSFGDTLRREKKRQEILKLLAEKKKAKETMEKETVEKEPEVKNEEVKKDDAQASGVA
jgi:hypothetical protein